jgi:hypothetical protein
MSRWLDVSVLGSLLECRIKRPGEAHRAKHAVSGMSWTPYSFTTRAAAVHVLSSTSVLQYATNDA